LNALFLKDFVATGPDTKLRIKKYTPPVDAALKKEPIILVHGLLNSSELFDVPGLEDMSLAISLVKEGFSVYTYDQRGAGESVCENWDFGLNENSFIDLPAIIKYVLDHSGAEKVVLGGYSLGGLIIYGLYTYISKFDASINGISKENISRMFTIASPGALHQRIGPWRNTFVRGEKIMEGADGSIDRSRFMQGQIYIRSPFFSRFVGLRTIEFCSRIAGRSRFWASIIKVLPVPSLFYSRSDFDSKSFSKIVASKVFDRTSTRIFRELFHFASLDGTIRFICNEQEILLPKDFDYWARIPLLLISSDEDKLVCSSEVDEVKKHVNSAVLFNTDKEIGKGCGHAGYLFKRSLAETVRKMIISFLQEGSENEC
jgi:pimeloyl-ACP methyl ester carboxylesterase